MLLHFLDLAAAGVVELRILEFLVLVWVLLLLRVVLGFFQMPQSLGLVELGLQVVKEFFARFQIWIQNN